MTAQLSKHGNVTLRVIIDELNAVHLPVAIKTTWCGEKADRARMMTANEFVSHHAVCPECCQHYMAS